MSHLTDILSLHAIARSDTQRAMRTGIPEVILADRKNIAQNIAIATTILKNEERVILSRVTPDVLAALQHHFPGQVDAGITGTTVIIRQPNHIITPTGGSVGILTAGTSDIPAAEEAAVICRETGCRVTIACDVGVAGLHRLYEPLNTMLTNDAVHVIIVAAGMDGALPSVVAGLVGVPVIGLPTSVGYGFGGEGIAALLSMLQTCAPGLAVVNIDNGIGAGAMAARIANNAAIQHTTSPTTHQ